MEKLPQKHMLELGIEFLAELLLFLYPYGADQMGLPHNFWLGLGCWIVGAAIAIRMFWILPVWADRLSNLLKATVIAILLAFFVWASYRPVITAYGKRNATTETAANLPAKQPPTPESVPKEPINRIAPTHEHSASATPTPPPHIVFDGARDFRISGNYFDDADKSAIHAPHSQGGQVDNNQFGPGAPAPLNQEIAVPGPNPYLDISPAELVTKTTELISQIDTVYDQFRARRDRNRHMLEADLAEASDKSEEERNKISNRYSDWTRRIGFGTVSQYIDCCKRDAIHIREALIVKGPPGTRSESSAIFYDLGPSDGNPTVLLSITDDLKRMADMVAKPQ